MLAPFFEESDWFKRRMALIHQHHRERVACFKLEEASLQGLGRTHREQLAHLVSPSASDYAVLTRQQTQDIGEWQQRKAANRLAMQTRQREEIAALEGER